MLHVVGSSLFTPNPENTALFLKDALDFNTQFALGQWWADNGSASFCLTKTDTESDNLLHVQSSNFSADCQALLARSDVTAVSEVENREEILTQTFQCECGLKLLLFHECDEDERDELIPLPISLQWDEGVMLKTQRILKVTPIPFRDKARAQVTELAEFKAVSAGNLTVSEKDAMQAFAEVTPEFQHRALFEAMESEAIKAEAYLDNSSWADEAATNDQ